MKMIAIAMLAAAADPPPQLTPGLDGFDLRRVKIPDRCGGSADAEIVVCGRRIPKEVAIDGSKFEHGPLRAEARLPFGGTVNAHAEQHAFPNGASAPAAMITFKWPF